MVIADYYIISIGQKIPEINLDHTINVNSYKIPMKNYSTQSSEMFFLRILKGVCYDFSPLERGRDYYDHDTYEWFESNNGKVIISDKYKDKVIEILQTYIDSSPVDCIGVFFRLEGYKNRTVKGVYTQKCFESMLLKGLVDFNSLYLVSKTGLYNRDEYWKISNKSDIIESLKPILKEKGFKKIRNYWYKTYNDMTFYLNIQGSCYDSNDYYVNLGIVLSSIQEKIPPIYEWDVCRRIFVDEKQLNISIDDILLILDYFINLFPTKDSVISFIDNQKTKYSYIIFDHYKL